MRILCDQDEVLCQWGSRVLQYYNEDMRTEKRGIWTDLTLDDIKEWDFKMSMGPGSEVYIRSYMRSVGFYENLEPCDGAIEGLKFLIADHDVMIATAVPKCAPMAYAGKIEWLRKNVPELSLDNMTAVKRKDWLDGDVLIDDGLHNIIPFWKKGGNVILMDRPWNRPLGHDVPAKMTTSDRFWRADGWLGDDGVLACIRHLEDLRKIGASPRC